MTFTYTVDLRPEFASAQTIPATITDIRDGDGDDLLDVAARFPGRQELEDLGSFTVQLHGAALNVLSVSYYEPTLGAFDGLPMGGVIKGVFEALTGEHRINLDTQREALLHGREIAASVDVAAYAAWTTALEEVGGTSGVPTLMYYVDGHLEVQQNGNQY